MIRVLLVVDAIAPLQGIAPIRWTKIAKYLKIEHKNDIKITVLTNYKNYDNPNSASRIYPKDVLLEKEMKYFDEYIAVPTDKYFSFAHWYKRRVIGNNNHFFTGKDAVGNGVKAKIKGRMRMYYLTYYNYATYKVLWNYIKKRLFEFDIVISSYDPIWPFMVCKEIAKEEKRIKWIADFRDNCGRANLNVAGTAGFALWHRKYVKKWSYLAEAVLRVDEGVTTYTEDSVKKYVVTNGYDPMEALIPEKPEMFDLIYTGTLYGKLSDFRIVYQALNELVAEGLISNEKIRVLYAGRSGQQAQLIADLAGGTSYFVNLNEIPRKSVLELQKKCAILIQAAWNIEGDDCGWTGKMYEYMMSQKPIVYIVNGDVPFSLPSQDMTKLGGVCYEACRHKETYPDLKYFILDKYKEWATTGNVTIKRNDAYVEKYSYKNIAETVWNLMNSF